MLALFCDDGGPGPVPYRCRECIYAFHGTDNSVPYGASCDGAAGRETRPLRGGASRAQCRLVMVLNHVKGLSPRARSRGLRTELTHAVNEMRRSLHALRLVGMTGFLNLVTLPSPGVRINLLKRWQPIRFCISCHLFWQWDKGVGSAVPVILPLYPMIRTRARVLGCMFPNTAQQAHKMQDHTLLPCRLQILYGFCR